MVGILNSTESVLVRKFAQIKSGLPSPLTSAATTDTGPRPTTCGKVNAKPLPLFVKTETVFPFPTPPFAQIKSSLPSPLTSAVVTEKTPDWVVEKNGAKPPLPLFVSTSSKSLARELQIKSTLPSPFTSAAVIAAGAAPTDGEEESTKLPPPLFVKTESVPTW